MSDLGQKLQDGIRIAPWVLNTLKMLNSLQSTLRFWVEKLSLYSRKWCILD